MAKSIQSPQAEAPLTMDLPDVFESTAIDVIATRSPVPYVVFAQPKAMDQWADLTAKCPGITDGDQILVRPDPLPPIRITPMRFTCIVAKQYWLQKDGSGNRIGNPHMKPGPGLKEEVFASLLVYHDGQAIPASCAFKTVKCGAILSVKLQIDAAEKADWAQQSDTHRLAFAACARPFLRVVGTVSTNRRTSGGGNPYVGAKSVISPSTPSEWAAVKRLLDDQGDPKANPPVPSGMERLKLLAQHYHTRLAEMGVK